VNEKSCFDSQTWRPALTPTQPLIEWVLEVFIGTAARA